MEGAAATGGKGGGEIVGSEGQRAVFRQAAAHLDATAAGAHLHPPELAAVGDVGCGKIEPAVTEGEARRTGASSTAVDVAQQLQLIGDRIDPVQLFTDPDAVVLATGDEVERALHVHQIAGIGPIAARPKIEHPGAAAHRINLPELTAQPIAVGAIGKGREIEGVAHSREPGRVIAPL